MAEQTSDVVNEVRRLLAAGVPKTIISDRLRIGYKNIRAIADGDMSRVNIRPNKFRARKPVVDSTGEAERRPRRNTVFCSSSSGSLLDARTLAEPVKDYGPSRFCAFIAGDPRLAAKMGAAIFCGRKSVDGFSYCEAHKLRCYQPVKPLKIGAY